MRRRRRYRETAADFDDDAGGDEGAPDGPPHLRSARSRPAPIASGHSIAALTHSGASTPAAAAGADAGFAGFEELMAAAAMGATTGAPASQETAGGGEALDVLLAFLVQQKQARERASQEQQQQAAAAAVYAAQAQLQLALQQQQQVSMAQALGPHASAAATPQGLGQLQQLPLFSPPPYQQQLQQQAYGSLPPAFGGFASPPPAQALPFSGPIAALQAQLAQVQAAQIGLLGGPPPVAPTPPPAPAAAPTPLLPTPAQAHAQQVQQARALHAELQVRYGGRGLP